jgi:hypothetical protein
VPEVEFCPKTSAIPIMENGFCLKLMRGMFIGYENGKYTQRRQAS